MKTSLFLLAGLLALTSAFAQTQKGNGILTANFSASYTRQSFTNLTNNTTSYGKIWSPSLSLTVGRFWADNWLAGVALSGTSTLIRQNYANYPGRTFPTSQVSGTITPFVRRYWPVGPLYLFAGAGVSVTVGGSKQTVVNSIGLPIVDGTKSSSWNVNPFVEAGVNYFLTNRLSLQLTTSTTSLPLTSASVSAGLVYWTGADRKATGQPEQANPQTDKGRWVLEGSFSANNQSTDQTILGYKSNTSSYSFSPSVGVFLGKNTLVGISIPLSYSKTSLTDTSPATIGTDFWLVGISPYVQHYWLSSRLTPYTRVNVGYSHLSYVENTGYTVIGGASVGLAYMAGQRFIIETSLIRASANYSLSKDTDQNSKTEAWGGSVSAGLSGSFAIRYVLPGR